MARTLMLPWAIAPALPKVDPRHKRIAGGEETQS
jgi:hypothetical protein